MQFWSKKWAHKVDGYQKFEMYSLAVRELVKRFYTILYDSGPLTVCSPDAAFNVLANNPINWTPKMTRYLSYTTPLNIRFCCPGPDQRPELEILEKPINDDPPVIDRTQGLLPKLQGFFGVLDEQILRKIPTVNTDGGCIRSKATGERKGSIGVYWGVESPFNVSRLTSRLPFTN